MNQPDLKTQILSEIQAAQSGRVWTPADFAALGNRDAVDKALQRLAKSGELRRIDRGLYDRPRFNSLTKKPTNSDYREILAALARRDQIRILVDGLTAANDLGLTDAVPAHVIVHTDARRRAIKVGNLTIKFKLTAPSKLYWADRPAMRVIQALHWLKDMLPRDEKRIMARLTAILGEPQYGPSIRQDLENGLKAIPAWMQRIVRLLLGQTTTQKNAARTVAPPPKKQASKSSRKATS